MLNLDALKELGLDTEEGMAFCAEDEDFYGEMLAEYLKESREKADELARYFSAGDWDGYRICVHSIKSTSRMIGAADLSEEARELEYAAKEGKKAAILAGHEGFLQRYTELTNDLRAVLE